MSWNGAAAATLGTVRTALHFIRINSMWRANVNMRIVAMSPSSARNCGQNALGMQYYMAYCRAMRYVMFVYVYLCEFRAHPRSLYAVSQFGVAWNFAEVGHAFICNI